MMRLERLVAPREHGRVLVEPEGGELRRLLREDVRGADVRVGDVTLGELRASLRRRLGVDGPVILSGHQAEFYHAGVFAKAIAASLLSAAVGAAPWFLWVDSDVPRTTSLAVPERTGHALRRVNVEYMAPLEEVPAESLSALPLDQWREFFAQVSERSRAAESSVLPTFVAGWLGGGSGAVHLVDGLARGRGAVERALGLRPARDLRVSELSQTPEFAALLGHALLNAGALAAAYNAALEAYRRRFRVRAHGRPVPPLVSDSRVEVPFWAYRPGEARRRLFVSGGPDRVGLYADDERIGVVSSASLARFERGAELAGALGAWRVRPRALALSGFTRLLLSDVFVHGIGGARYDVMTDDVVRRFLGCEPAPMACVTATLHVEQAAARVTRDDLITARRRSRDLRFNPQRYLRSVPAELLENRDALLVRSERLRALHPRDRAARRVVFGEIRRVNEQILKTDPWRAAEFDQRIDSLLHEWRASQIALDREYFYAFHSPSALASLVSGLRSALGV